MRFSTRFLPVLFLAILLPGASFAAAPATPAVATTASATASNPQNPWGNYTVPAAPDVDATNYVLMDAQNGEVIASKNANDKVPPASLTKLMALYLVFKDLASGQIHLTDNVPISETAWKTGGSRMFVKVGTQVSLEDLIQGVIVQSGNDATMALAEYVGGTVPVFVQMMNQQAQQLGMTNSHFVDPTGLPAPDHLTTAYDLALLAKALITEYPQYYHYFGEKWFTWNNIRQPNRNRLLWRNFNVDGLKTGHTDEAGFCLVGSALQNNTRLISILLHAPSDDARANDSQALLNYGFRFFENAQIYKANQPITQQRAWKGADKYVSLGVLKDFGVLIPRSAYPDLKVSITVNSNIVAPITKGQAFGTINVYLKNQQIASTPLVALTDDAQGGWWTRFIDSIIHFFHRLFHKSESAEIVIGNNS